MNPRQILSFLTILLLLSLIVAIATFADQRTALIIGNADYAAAPLANPENDSKALAQQLTATGFKVTLLNNLGQAAMYDAVDSFINESLKTRELLFFYAGHAIQVNGKNFLIPVDASFGSDDLLSGLFDLRYLLDKLTDLHSARIKIIMLDACRDNPFSQHPLASSGLAEITAPSGTFIAFSTAPGKTADDGDDSNSPYIKHFLRCMSLPGRKIEDIFKEVRIRVKESTAGQQVPWEATSLEGDFYFLPPLERPTKRTPANKGSSRIDRKKCDKIMMKLSLGMEALTIEEQKLMQIVCR